MVAVGRPVEPSMSKNLKSVLAALALLAVLAAGWLGWGRLNDNGPGPGFVTGNGRVEATEIAVATRQAGRLREVLVVEGEFVRAGQPLARLELEGLQAQRDEAQARVQQAQDAVASATVAVAARQSDHQSALAQVAQRESDLEVARRKLARSEELAARGFISGQVFDDDRARVNGLQAALQAARAQAAAAQTAIAAARTQVTGAQSNARAMEATLRRIDVELAESELKAPRDGRVQYRVAQPGEIVAAGGRVLNLIDLSDVYFTFFLPETVAGRVALGSEVRIVLDAAPGYVIPARVSFVASTAQFTPKTVETASERQKLMFRVRAQIDRELLLRHLERVKTGLPGVAWIRIDPQAEWPARMAVNVAR